MQHMFSAVGLLPDHESVLRIWLPRYNVLQTLKNRPKIAKML